MYVDRESNSKTKHHNIILLLIPIKVNIIVTVADPPCPEEIDLPTGSLIETNNEEEAQPGLEPEFLEALGEATNEKPKYGEDIHPDLAQRWLPILSKGLASEVKEKLFTEYIIPSNCKLLKAPMLNLEISTAITESLKNRDKKLEVMQEQLGKGITAISRAMSVILHNKDHVKAIKMLSDATRILLDVHYSETQQRIKLLTPNLDKSFLTIIENECRDETLFGENLSEKIKSAKSIERQGLSIKKTTTAQKPISTAGTSRPKQGNWGGPPRFQMTRGGRTGPRMTTSTQPYRRAPVAAPPPPAHSRSNHSYSSRHRAPQRR